jgi:hypothetical protein
VARCAALKADGERCNGEAMPGAEWCYGHHPDYQEQRQRNASKGGRRGGRGRPVRAGSEGLQDIKNLLSDLTTGVLSGEVDRATAIAANQLLNTSLRALEVGRKLQEQENLERRLEALESVLKVRKTG